jgi:hypothetical protein
MSKNTEALLNKIAQIDSEKEITTYVGIRKEEVDIDFAMVFIETLHKLVSEKKVTMTDINIFLYLSKLAEYGNLLSFNTTRLSKVLSIDRGNVSRSISKLSKLGVLIKVDSGLFINPFLVSKGRLARVEPDVLKVAMTHTDLIPNPFPRLRRGNVKESTTESESPIDQTELPF